MATKTPAKSKPKTSAPAKPAKRALTELAVVPPAILNKETELVPLSRLLEHPRNPRRSDDESIAELIVEHGFFGFVGAQRSTGYVLWGNGRLRGAHRLKMPVIPTVWLDVDDRQALKILLADNAAHERGTYAHEDLAAILRELADDGGLTGTGYADGDLDAILARVDPEPEFAKHQTAYWEIARLKPHPKNYKTHPPDQLAQLAESIRQHGFFRNVVVTTCGTILSGHGVTEAAKLNNLTKVPVFVLDIDPASTQALKILITDNELPKFGETNDRLLTELLRVIQETDPLALLGTGYDAENVAALVYVTRPASEVQSFDDAAQWVGMPEYDVGTKAVQLIINFDTMEDRDRFLKEVLPNWNILKKLDRDHLWTTRWPVADREDAAALRFEHGPAEEPRDGFLGLDLDGIMDDFEPQPA